MNRKEDAGAKWTETWLTCSIGQWIVRKKEDMHPLQMWTFRMTKGMTDRMKKTREIIRVSTTLAMVYVAFSNKGVFAVLVAG